MQVTISFLPVSLSLVRIPRSRLSKLFHPLLRQILNPDPSFLNITCNELELSVFAESDVLQDFEPIARKDRQKRLSRSRSTARGSPSSKADDCEYVEISYDTWNVLQIDSHSDRLDNSGARIHEFSAPIAAAGISILYLSSYMSDFIFVKSTHVQGVMSLLATAGFDLYPLDLTHSISQASPLFSPMPPDDTSPAAHDSSPEHTSTRVITRSRRGTDSSLTSILLRASSKAPSESSEEDVPVTRSKSHSPSASQVTVLGPNLTCVGLSDDHADVWTLKIVKLVAFPGLIPALSASSKHSPSTSSSYSQPHSPSFEFGCSSNGILTPSDSSSDENEDEQRGPLNEAPTPLPSAPRCSVPNLSMTRLNTTAHKPNGHTPRPETRRNSDARPRDHVPFYSFTRTLEGSSLTTDVQLLAALFPQKERYMVICSDELENVQNGDPPNEDMELEDGSEPVQLSGTMKCLQIDLRNFGLDKHGLVNRYSQVLHENGINHMYSSTFKTANLLVDKAHARRAQELLRSC